MTRDHLTHVDQPSDPERSYYDSLRGALTLPAAEITPQMIRAARQAELDAALRGRLPQDHPQRAGLTERARLLAIRHATTRHALRPLLQAWAEAGIPVMMFKGFALSEFEYLTTSERFYRDVDVLIPPDLAVVQRAVKIARRFGWLSDRLEDVPRRPDWLHGSTHLFSPSRDVRLDVHRWVVPALFIPRSRAAALTAGLWRRANAVDWDGVPVLRPDVRDQVLLTLMVNRVWGGDQGVLKGADLLDLQVLRRHVDTPALDTHARQLGIFHTWKAFEEICSPAGSLDPLITRPHLQAARIADGGRAGRTTRNRIGRVLELLPFVPAVLPDVLWAAWAVRRGGDPRRHLARWEGRPALRPLTPDRLDRTLTTVRHLTWWLHPRRRREGICLPRAYASYRALRRAGHPAVFLSGVARPGTALLSHAWVEDHLGSMDAYGEPRNRLTFRPIIEYPPAGFR